MAEAQSPIRSPISTAELQRRWAAARAAIKGAGLDAIVLQSSEDWMGGYTRWFTDTPATNAYPRSVIFPADGLMTTCEVGIFGGEWSYNGEHSEFRGIGKRVSTPSFNGAVDYTTRYDAELMANELKRAGYRRVGMVGAGGMYHGFAQGLKDLLPNVQWEDATDLIDDIKCIKSAEEIRLIRETAAMQDEVMALLLDYVKPGMKEFEVAAYMQYLTTLRGGSQGLYIVMATPPGQPAFVKPKYMQGRTIEKGDVVGIMIECNGPAGFYTHLFRFAVMGKAPQGVLDAHKLVLEAEQNVLDRMKPGVSCADVFAAHNEFMRAHKLPEEKRILCHGQGYEMVERPLIRRDESMTLRENMNIGLHAAMVVDKNFMSNTNNFLIGARGPERLHKTPQQLFELA
jgi:Xaa-Pro aminopeptidase